MLRLLMLLLSCLTLTSCAHAEGDVSLLAINVGKADALLLRSGGSAYLIDTGTEASWGQLSRALKTEGVTRLDGVIVTHTDGDHAGGAQALAMSSIQVDGWYAPVWYTRKESKHKVIRAAALRGQEVAWLSGGDTLPLEGGSITVLGPVEPSEKENNNSLVLLVEAGGGRMLLAGDMEFPEEQTLLDAGLIPACQVLKVGNHGEDDATSAALIEAVQPKLAVISTNTMEEPDTPSPRVITLLQSAGAKIVQTQAASAGVLVWMREGQAEASLRDWPVPPEAPQGMALLDKGEDDTIRLQNTGAQPIDLTDWFILSERGEELFVFPAGAIAQPGEIIAVSSESSERLGDYVWPDTKVWHTSKQDTARLFDPYGREMSVLK